MKYFKSVLVFLLIVVVPAGSWYYLKSGLDYRKNALKTLESKGSVFSFCDELSALRGSTTVIVNRTQSTAKTSPDDFIKMLLSEFDDVPNLDIIEVGAAKNERALVPGVVFKELPANCWNRFSAMTLIDSSGTIRMSYDLKKDDFKDLVEHLATVLPKEAERDIIKKDYDTQ